MSQHPLGGVGTPPDPSAPSDPEIPMRFYWDSINNPGGRDWGAPGGSQNPPGGPKPPSGAVLALGAAQGDGDVVVLQVTRPAGTPKTSQLIPRIPKILILPNPRTVNPAQNLQLSPQNVQVFPKFSRCPDLKPSSQPQNLQPNPKTSNTTPNLHPNPKSSSSLFDPKAPGFLQEPIPPENEDIPPGKG